MCFFKSELSNGEKKVAPATPPSTPTTQSVGNSPMSTAAPFTPERQNFSQKGSGVVFSLKQEAAQSSFTGRIINTHV